jgi:azurin
MFRFAVIAAASVVLAAPAFAADCNVQVEANDAMQFNTKSIDVPKSCKTFVVNFKHVGKLPKASMGHNWVLAKAADVDGINKDGIAAGVNSNYLKAGDARVLAATKLLGGGESDSATIDVAKLKAGDAYTFFCSFPGHAALMKGALQLK